jgi:hypothetical protein
MNHSSVSHTAIADASYSLENAIGRHFIQDINRLQMTLHVYLPYGVYSNTFF